MPNNQEKRSPQGASNKEAKANGPKKRANPNRARKKEGEKTRPNHKAQNTSKFKNRAPRAPGGETQEC
jgi:hypothetical protein